MIYYKDILAGILSETDDGDYIFKYDKVNIINYPLQFITFTTPVREEVYWIFSKHYK